MSENTKPIRLKIETPMQDVRYIFQDRKGDWRAATASGLPLSIKDAACISDQMALIFDLEDSDYPEHALQALKKHIPKDVKASLA